jgi:branched-chain amino acid transport system ATP-binding protein
LAILLETKGLRKEFGGVKAVQDVDFSVTSGSVKAVIGPNGAGKTTFFNLVSGFLPVTGGGVLFCGDRVNGFASHRIASLGIARTFQNLQLFDNMTVLENVMVGCHTRSKAGFLKCGFRLPGQIAEERRIRDWAMEALDFVGLADTADKEPGQIPFESQRRVEIARALALKPKLMLMDEPAAGLNIRETEGMAGMIRKLCDHGITIVLVEHDMSLVMGISDEIMVLNFGVKIAEGAPREIQNNEEVITAYLGKEHNADR